MTGLYEAWDEKMVLDRYCRCIKYAEAGVYRCFNVNLVVLT